MDVDDDIFIVDILLFNNKTEWIFKLRRRFLNLFLKIVKIIIVLIAMLPLPHVLLFTIQGHLLILVFLYVPTVRGLIEL